ncbi:MAG: DNA polymerase I [Phycisphaerales bacterium]|jgi:DNA polymerase-1|nr:DNA polymerase I [Phycisphaerales bacterium]
MSETLCLIDGYSQFFRAYYARRPYQSSSVTNEPTKLVAGFLDILLHLLESRTPTYLAVALDVSGDTGTFRSDIDPEYKQNREAAPDDFHPQVERCLQLLEAMGVPVLGVEGAEADDVIATLAARLEASHPDLDVVVISADKDLAQIVNPRTIIFDPQRDVERTPSDIFKTEGVQASHVVDILSLMGDTVDNIPGITGIGPKTAAKLILQYGSIEGIYEHLDEIKGKRRENLEGGEARLLMNRELIRLREDLDFAFSLDDARCNPADLPVDRMGPLLRELDFNRAAQRLGGLVTSARTEQGETDASLDAGTLWADHDASGAPRPADPDAAYTMVASKADLADVAQRASAADVVAFDVETTGLDSMQCDLCGVSLAWEEGSAVYIPIRSSEPDSHLDEAAVLEGLRSLLQDASITKVAHNAKFDLNVLHAAGLEVRGPVKDTMIASYVADATRSSHRMDALALGLLGLQCIPISSLIGVGKTQRTFDTVALDRAVPYAAEDADVTLRLLPPLQARVAAEGLTPLLEEMEYPLVRVLADMEFAGVRIEPAELDRQRLRLSDRLDALRERIADAAPCPMNPDSPKQLAAALFNDPGADPPGLGLTPIKRRKTGPSTDVEVLEKLEADPEVDTPLPGFILEYRQLTKLVNTYLVSLKECINPRTGRVHASFNQTVTATGRLSSSDPNLQNIPIRTDLGRDIRRAFVAEPGCVLVTADYSQVELRILAHLSGDEALQQAFRDGEDIHAAVASEVFSVPLDQVTREQRGAAKMVNFGIVYGITPYGLSRRLGDGTDVPRAAAIIRDYKARFRGIDAFLESCIEKAQKDGFVETMCGRRRRITEIDSADQQRRGLAERLAINSVVQGSAADLIKRAMIDLHAALPSVSPDARLVLQVHDELVVETPESRADAARDLLVSCMEGAMTLDVPIVVDVSVSQSWFDAK